ncbi:MAG: hypothetical protein JWN40_4013 [Phycisphaerales bacterium]|nr:hypothetical protein [Phycisphaerales bacterium]
MKFGLEGGVAPPAEEGVAVDVEAACDQGGAHAGEEMAEGGELAGGEHVVLAGGFVLQILVRLVRHGARRCIVVREGARDGGGWCAMGRWVYGSVIGIEHCLPLS